MNKSIGIVGFGYWGKIIFRNLRQLGYSNITICETKEIEWVEVGEKHTQIYDYKELNCESVFVVVPVENHYKVCKHFLERGIDVFCEKPLDTNLENCLELYKIAEKHNCNLFVDWIFVYNPAVSQIKKLIQKFGKPISIIANRMNFGPVRNDVNARWDLASHDVSIACHLLEQVPQESKWLDFNRNKNSTQNDSSVGILTFSNTSVQINTSWHYGIKNRMYVFEFEDFFVHWDDNTNTILYRNEIVPTEEYSPLHMSIKTFLSKNDKQNNKKLTLNITSTLQH